MSRTISILGSTGSIGVTTLRVLRFLKNEYRVHGLACRGNLELLDQQIQEFRPAIVAVESADITAADNYREMKNKYPETEFLEQEAGVIEMAGRKVDVLVSAIVGAAGLKPTLAGISAASRIALANKETLVMAGDIVMRSAAAAGVELLPVDSEHSAVFSLFSGLSRGDIRRIILTASGGGLRDVAHYELSAVTPERALDHPTWDMGNKITIDSATLMNKGFEVIEAHHFFNMPYDAIDVIIHPESVVHSMVETVDGALYAHMGVADMAHPIHAALTYPAKCENPFGRLNLEEVGKLTFLGRDRQRYPSLDLCYSAGRRGGTMPAALNASNEEAVSAFLSGAIRFTDIVKVVEKVMEKHRVIDDPGLDDIFAADAEVRKQAHIIIETNIKGEMK